MPLPSPDERADVSWIIPTYNEAPIIVETVRQVLEWGVRKDRRVEVVVVDDGNDALEQRLARAELGGAVRYIRGPRRGKGAAVREGILRSGGRVVVYCDADLPLSTADMEACVSAVESGTASYAVPERSWTFHGPLRTVASVVLWLLQRSLIFGDRSFFDTQCGFKVFRRDLARRLASEQVASGGMFDIEYLYRSSRAGESVFKLHVQQRPEIRPSTIRVLRCLVRDPIDLVRIKTRGGRARRRGGSG